MMQIEQQILIGRFITSVFPVYGFVLLLTIIFIFVMQYHDNLQSI